MNLPTDMEPRLEFPIIGFFRQLVDVILCISLWSMVKYIYIELDYCIYIYIYIYIWGPRWHSA